MNSKSIATAFLFALFLTNGFAQNSNQSPQTSLKDSVRDFKFSINTTWLSFANFGDEKTNTQHYELHFRYKLSQKDKIGIKVATWKLFAPMGIPLWDPLFLKESEFYAGRLKEDGIGLTYQRMVWKGLFATLEVLPQLKTYLDENDKKIGNGFKLYTSYHLGYHVPLIKNRMFIEPQIQGQYWPIDTNAPESFKAKDRKWKNYFLFEPNLYIGIKF
ncbi:MAG TPA: hypothetical protein VF602_00925 [Pedobacter sp.]|jgi:hypothetical protein